MLSMDLVGAPSGAVCCRQDDFDQAGGATDVEMATIGRRCQKSLEIKPLARRTIGEIECHPIAETTGGEAAMECGAREGACCVMQMERSLRLIQVVGRCQNRGDADAAGDEDSFLGRWGDGEQVPRRAYLDQVTHMQRFVDGN